jgi:hypothetical protein
MTKKTNVTQCFMKNGKKTDTSTTTTVDTMTALSTSLKKCHAEE